MGVFGPAGAGEFSDGEKRFPHVCSPVVKRVVWPVAFGLVGDCCAGCGECVSEFVAFWVVEVAVLLDGFAWCPAAHVDDHCTIGDRVW